MKITDVTLTLFGWSGIPPTTYGRHTGRFGGESQLGLIMAIRNCEFFEVLLPAGAQKYGLAVDIEVDGQGLVHAPGGPGLGAQLDHELIARRTLAVLR